MRIFFYGDVPAGAGAAATAVVVAAGSVAAGVVSVGLAAFLSLDFLKAAFSLAFKLLSALGAVTRKKNRGCQQWIRTLATCTWEA